ncbi:hypothetical protein JQX13_42615 [Archangium violaceum]|nr:hypothetical protein JQX13_42615 [Archangium violaceum]
MDHLSDGLQLAEIRRLMVVIEEQLPLVGLIEVPLDDERRDMARVARAAKALQAALDKARPFMGEDDDGVETFGWGKFDAMLADLHKSATFWAKQQPARRRGRPRKQAWRDELITVVWNAYPAEHRKKTRDGHFERTIEMLLRFLGAPVEDVHLAVISALTRR